MTHPTSPEGQIEQRVTELAGKARALCKELAKVVLGQDRLVEDLVVALFAGGHVLLEGMPGLGKTLLVKTLAQGLGLAFSRVQFTPDLMPSDVLGTRIFEDTGQERRFRFQKGPVFTNLLLADEINRATPKTQSALLEAMQEASVTIAGETHALPDPFAVIATQNPIELEGTYPLPEAQLDRFLFKLDVPSPSTADLVRILGQTTGSATATAKKVLSGPEVLEVQAIARRILCGEHLLRFVAHLIRATHPQLPDADEKTKTLVRYGASPRAGQAIVRAAKVRALLDARPSVSKADLESCALPALRHRVVLSFEAEACRARVETLLPTWLELAGRLAARG